MRTIILALLVIVPGSLFALNFDAPNDVDNLGVDLNQAMNADDFVTADEDTLNLEDGATNEWWGGGWGGGWGGWGWGGWGGWGWPFYIAPWLLYGGWGFGGWGGGW